MHTSTVQNQVLDQMYKAIGLAIASCQFFEVLFAICVKLIFSQSKAVDLSDIKPLRKATFRKPTRAIMEELRQHINVDAQFEYTLQDAVERRHRLIHRWAIENRWPGSEDYESQKELLEFAKDLSAEANGLSRLLVPYIYEWMKKFPDLSSNLEPLDKQWLSALPEQMRSLRIEET